MIGSKTVIVAGIIIAVAVVAAVVSILYQASTANQSITSNGNLSSNEVSISQPASLQAGEIVTLTDGQKAVAFPLVEGFYKGKPLLFIHTDASDPNVASMMTMMVNYTTQYSPRIANVSNSALAEVYVFQNGVQGANPFGFQSDVFDSVPTDASYSPLRKVFFVEWNANITEPRVLKSVEEITAAQRNGDLTIIETDKVVIMPVIQWDKTATSDNGIIPEEFDGSANAVAAARNFLLARLPQLGIQIQDELRQLHTDMVVVETETEYRIDFSVIDQNGQSHDGYVEVSNGEVMLAVMDGKSIL